MNEDRIPKGWMLGRVRDGFVTDDEQQIVDKHRRLDPSLHQLVEDLDRAAYIHEFVLTDMDGNELAQGYSTTVNYDIMDFYAARGATGIAFLPFDHDIPADADRSQRNVAAMHWAKKVERAEYAVGIWLDCQDGDHRWEIIEEVGTGPVQLSCSRCSASLDIVQADTELAELREKVAFLRRGAGRISHEELVQKITAVGAAEWKAGDWLSRQLDEQRQRIRAEHAALDMHDLMGQRGVTGIEVPMDPKPLIVDPDTVRFHTR